jgi:ABC-type uncharacterized transport system permease subunit
MKIQVKVTGIIEDHLPPNSSNPMQLEVAGGAGFVGIAVALMGRSHPIGVVLAAVLFGMLFQGGAELAFEMPKISRDMIVVIQALVILFAGALEHMFRPAIIRLFTVLSSKSAEPAPAGEGA